MNMSTVINVIRSVKRKRNSNRCIYDSAFIENGPKSRQEFSDKLATISENDINIKKTLSDQNSNDMKRKCTPFNLKQCKKQLSFQRFRQQSKEEDGDKVFGEICDIRHSPYRIFKAAENGNVEEFERLYKIDNSRISYRNAKGRTCVHFAASANRVNILTSIYNYNGDLNIMDNEGNTPMHDSIRNNACDSLNFLLEKNADSSILNCELYAPLHLAAILNKVDCIKVFIKHRNRIDVEIRGKQGRSALHLAAIHDHDEVAFLLLTELKCCPKMTCDNQYAPIHEAARNASVKVLQTILESSKDCGYTTSELMAGYDGEGNVPLHSAVHAGDIKAVEICLKFGSNISSQQHDLSTPLHLACSQGALDIVKLMLNNSLQEKMSLLSIPDAQQMTAIHCAAMFDHAELVDYLCTMDANLDAEDKDGRTVLLLASARAAWKCVKTLIRRNAKIDHKDSYNRNILHHIVMNSGDVNEFNDLVFEVTKDENAFLSLLNEKDVFGCSALHYAAREGNLKTVQSLLELGSSLNVRNNDNQSALHFAARYGRYNTVKFLLETKEGNLIINDMDGEGMTNLHIASAFGHTRIVQLLLLKGALLHRDHRGRTPLHYAASYGHSCTMQQLLTVHSHLLDQQDREGNTALHLAAIKCKPNAASILLSLNCKIKKNFTECTAIDYALHMKNPEVMQALVLHPTRSLEIMNYPAKKYNSLIEGLIANMPEVMSAVLDTGIITSTDQSEDSKSFFIKYSFDCLRKVGDAPLSVLNLMVKYGREQLICHPLCLKYLETKWSSYGMYYHMIYLTIYFAFLMCLTTIVLEVVDSSYHSRIFREIVRDDLDHGNATRRRSYSFNHQFYNNHTYLDSNEPFISISMSTKFSCLFVSLFIFFSLIKEFHQMNQQKAYYFVDIINLMLWVLYLTSTFITFGVVFQTEIESSVLYIVSAIAIFLAWFNCLLYFQRFNTSGIYVVMFFEILLTLVRVLFVFCVLIIAFSLSFYILLTKFQQKKGFNSVPMSFVRIITMMLGEMDFLSTFLQPILEYQNQAVISKQIIAATWFLIMFAILMPILLMNLLIGLAVGDIETVRCNAQMKRLTMQVQMHTDLEMKVPKNFKMYVDKEEVFEYPNSNKCNKSFWTKFKSIFVNNKELNSLSYQNKSFSIGSSASSDILNEIHKQKNKLRNISRTLDQQLQMIKLIVKKVEVQTENDYNDYSSEISDDEDHVTGQTAKLTALSTKK